MNPYISLRLGENLSREQSIKFMSRCGYLLNEEKRLETVKPVPKRTGYHLTWQYLGKFGLLISEARGTQSSQLEPWILITLKSQSTSWSPQQSLPQDIAANTDALRAVKNPLMLGRARGGSSPRPKWCQDPGGRCSCSSCRRVPSRLPCPRGRRAEPQRAGGST